MNNERIVMKFEIKSRYSGKVLFTCEVASLRLAVELAVKSKANLRGASLLGANLQGAKNINKYLTTPLYILLDQPGKIRAYKLVNSTNEGIYKGGIKYLVGKSQKVSKANTDETAQCAEGISLATLGWCIKEWKPSYKILVAEFTKKDIACIPIGSDGKFRVRLCKIVGKKNLKELGLIEKKIK